MTLRNSTTKPPSAFTAASARFLAALAVGTFFAAAGPANAKDHARNAPHSADWRNVYAFSNAQVQPPRNPMRGGIYESLWGGRYYQGDRQLVGHDSGVGSAPNE
jgi:hypothetical protein